MGSEGKELSFLLHSWGTNHSCNDIKVCLLCIFPDPWFSNAGVYQNTWRTHDEHSRAGLLKRVGLSLWVYTKFLDDSDSNQSLRTTWMCLGCVIVEKYMRLSWAACWMQIKSESPLEAICNSSHSYVSQIGGSSYLCLNNHFPVSHSFTSWKTSVLITIPWSFHLILYLSIVRMPPILLSSCGSSGSNDEGLRKGRWPWYSNVLIKEDFPPISLDLFFSFLPYILSCYYKLFYKTYIFDI